MRYFKTLYMIALVTITSLFTPKASMGALEDNLAKLHHNLSMLHNALEKNILLPLQPELIPPSNKPQNIYFATASREMDERIADATDKDFFSMLGKKIGIALEQKNMDDSDWDNAKNQLFIYFPRRNETGDEFIRLTENFQAQNIVPIILILEWATYDYQQFNNAITVAQQMFPMYIVTFKFDSLEDTANNRQSVNEIRNELMRRTPEIQLNEPFYMPQEEKKPIKIIPVIQPEQIKPIEQPQLPKPKTPSSHELLYTSATGDWGAVDSVPQLINEFRALLGINLKRIDNPYDPLLQTNKALYLFSGPGRSAAPEVKSMVDRLTKQIAAQGGGCLIVLSPKSRDYGWGRIINDVPVFYFTFGFDGIIKTDTYEQEVHELRNALGLQ